MINSRTIKRLLVCFASAAAGLSVVYVVLIVTGTIPWPGACVQEELASIPNLSGMSFQITYTNCDTLAKQEAISVYASTTASRGESWFEKWLHRKTLLFRYDPSGRDKTLPSISATRRDRVLISVPEVSSILFQRPKWQNVSIDYRIERIDYP